MSFSIDGGQQKQSSPPRASCEVSWAHSSERRGSGRGCCWLVFWLDGPRAEKKPVYACAAARSMNGDDDACMSKTLRSIECSPPVPPSPPVSASRISRYPSLQSRWIYTEGPPTVLTHPACVEAPPPSYLQPSRRISRRQTCGTCQSRSPPLPLHLIGLQSPAPTSTLAGLPFLTSEPAFIPGRCPVPRAPHRSVCRVRVSPATCLFGMSGAGALAARR